jgi:hypothetical protein
MKKKFSSLVIVLLFLFTAFGFTACERQTPEEEATPDTPQSERPPGETPSPPQSERPSEETR